MLKNIEKLKEKGIEINQNHLKPELYSYEIPGYILKGLKLLRPGEKLRSPSKARTMARSSTMGKATNRTTENNSAVNTSAFDAYNSG